MRSNKAERKSRAQARRQRRPEVGRKPSPRRAILEALEPKTLLSTLPEPTVDLQADVISGQRGNEFGSFVDASPTDPDKMVAVWSNQDDLLPDQPTTNATAAYSTDGGQSWATLGLINRLTDFTTSADDPQPFEQNIVRGVGFDRDDNVYVLMTHNNAPDSPGAITLQRFDFSGQQPVRETFTTGDLLQDVVGTPNASSFRRVVHAWTDDVAFAPSLAIDDTVASFTDPETGQTQTNPSTGNVYIAWTTLDEPPGSNPDNFNPTAVKIVASSDQGQSFTTQRIVNDSGNFSATERNTTVQLAVSQGNLDDEVTAAPNETMAPGQVTLVWEDFGSGRFADPPRSSIVSDRITDGAAGAQFHSDDTPQVIQDALDTDPDTPTTTTSTIDVDLPSDFDITDLDVRVGLTHPALEELQIELVAPTGETIDLINTEPDSGADLGITSVGNFIGTVFDQDAPRNINDFDLAGNRVAQGPFIGHFEPRFDFANPSGLDIYGTEDTPRDGDELDGTWQLVITDFVNGSFDDDDPPELAGWSLNFTEGLAPSDNDSTIASTTLTTGPGPDELPAALEFGPGIPAAPNGRGVRPRPVIASDNTLGSFSPHQGRIYTAWAGRVETDNNPADNFDIFLKYSDDGGRTWNPGGPGILVNDDFGGDDGFSGGSGSLFAGGRPQFFPSIDVDQATGTVVIGFLDTRHDAAEARTVTTLTASHDGGATFSPQGLGPDGSIEPSDSIKSAPTGARRGIDPAASQLRSRRGWVNTGQLAVDATQGSVLTPETAVITGPLPDNQSSNFPVDSRFGSIFGLDMVVVDGRVVPVWAGNEDFAGFDNAGMDGSELVDIYTNQVRIAAGPRIIDATQGPIGLLNDQINTRRDENGAPIAEAFVVTFDRPIDPDTFTADDVRVFFEGIEPGTPTELTALDVIPLNLGDFGATRFRVEFEPSSQVGAYSYLVEPNLRDRIRFFRNGDLRLGAFMDQNADAETAPDAIDFMYNNTLTGDEAEQAAIARADTFARPRPLNGVQPDFEDPLKAPFDLTTLPLVVPGPTVTEVRLPNATDPNTDPRLIRDGEVDALDVVFDRDIDPDTFTPEDILRLIGPAGIVIEAEPGETSPFTVTPDPEGTGDQRLFRVEFPTQTVNGTYSLVLGPEIRSTTGHLLDSDLDAGVDAVRGTTVNGASDVVTVEVASGPIVDGDVPDGGTQEFLISVDQDFEVPTGGLRVRLNLTHPNVQELTGELVALNDPNDPDDDVVVRLFSPDSIQVPGADFDTTVFTDRPGATPVQEGGPPFFNPNGFNPEEAFTALFPLGASGDYALRITDNEADDGQTATLNSWALLFDREITGTGLGEPAADRASESFRIFVTDPADPRSSTIWTPVGPAPIEEGAGTTINTSAAGRVSAIAVDPSDPSGNTVYVGGASGGVWKSTNFLTDDPDGPTYVPLTDMGPNSAINIGALDVFGRGADPDRSVVFAGTGEADDAVIPGLAFGDGQTSRGVGFLRSTDGGKNWALLDSTENFDADGNPLPIDSPQRDHVFVGTSVFDVVVDPTPTPEGETIVYAAVVDPRPGNPAGGLWRSVDSGRSWDRMRAGQATDIVLDEFSPSESTGNFQRLFVAFQGEGVFLSPNRGQVFNQMLGNDALGLDDTPLRKDPDVVDSPIPVEDSETPNGNRGRIVLAKPKPTGDLAQDLTLQGFLYVAVAEPNDTVTDLYVTRDFGQVWTRTELHSPLIDGQQTGLFTDNDPAVPDHDFGGGQGNHALSLTPDPTNPYVVYLGGTRSEFLRTNPALTRIDTRLLLDGHDLTFFSTDAPDGGQLLPQTTTSDFAGADLKSLLNRGMPSVSDRFGNESPSGTQFLDLVRNPFTPFLANATFFASNVSEFNNGGWGVRPSRFDPMLAGANGVHHLLTVVDPKTGEPRLIAGTDNGVFTGVDNNGPLRTTVGGTSIPGGSRNGNLQISQLYSGAVQPSSVAADVAGAMFFGMSEDNGFPESRPDILETGDLTGRGDPFFGALSPQFNFGSGSHVATAQADSAGTVGDVYQFKFPALGGSFTDFFQVDDIGRTFGLGASDRGLWPGRGPILGPGIAFGEFAVNPLSNNQALIGDTAGRVYSTEDQGRTWISIGDPDAVGNALHTAFAYGAPDPDGPGGIGNLNNFLYVGTNTGRIFITERGGGANGNDWQEVSAGLDGSPVMHIETNPDRGSHEAYAVTREGVFYIPDSTVQGATWQNITSNLFDVVQQPFDNPDLAEDSVLDGQLHSLAVDWRYIIPEDFDDPDSPTHPIIYSAGASGVFRSLDNGQTWTSFPDNIADGEEGANTAADQGYLPHARVTDLDLSLGFINPDNGRPVINDNSENLMLATTFGRGQFAIRLAPLIIPESVQLSPTEPPPDGSDTGSGFDPGDEDDRVTSVARPVFEGIGEQTAFGNVVRVSIFNLNDPDNPELIGGFDPNDPSTDVPANYTDALGRFSVRVAEDLPDGEFVIGIQAVNDSGTRGNMVVLGDPNDPDNPPLVIDTTPPEAPNLIDLQTSVDTTPPPNSGFPPPPTDQDNLTSVTSPVFDISGVEAETTLLLLRDGSIVATQTGLSADPVEITDPGPLDDGTFVYEARLVDRAGNLSALSDPLEVVIDTEPPASPSAPDLLPADDTGVPDDRITANTQPRLTGLLDLAPNETTDDRLPLVQLVDTDGTVLGQSRVESDGTYTIRFDEPLADGVFTVQARAIDRAGNVGAVGPDFTLTILTSQPPDVTLGLSPTDDTGTPNDNITSVRQPRLIGTTGPNLTVELIDVDGSVTGTPGAVIGNSVLSQNNGRFQFQFPSPLPQGDHTVVAQAIDVAGNTNASAPLTITIDSTPPEGVPDLRLAPGSDTGILGDGRTSERRPFLIGTTDPNAEIEIVGPDGTVLAEGTADENGEFRLRLASNLVNGTIELRSRGRDVAGNVGPLSDPLTLRIVTTRGDYDVDGIADLALFRPEEANDLARFLVRRSTDDVLDQALGRPGDIPISGDFDGDGIVDLAVFRPDSDALPGASRWFILGSRTGPRSIFFGGSGLDLPAPADYDGDGITDIGVFRPDSDLLPGASEFFILRSSEGPRRVQFGMAGSDVPVPADFDGDGRDDLAVFRPDSDLNPGSAQFFILRSTEGAFSTPFGNANEDVPIPVDFDGDGRADIAVYRTETAQWVLRNESGGTITQSFGAPGDIPVPADFDGDGRADLTTFRASTGQWTIQQSSTSETEVREFGGPDDFPVLAPLAFRDFRPGTIVAPRRSAGQPAPASTARTDSAALQARGAVLSMAAAGSFDLGSQAARFSATGRSQQQTDDSSEGLGSVLGRGSALDRFRPAQELISNDGTDIEPMTNDDSEVGEIFRPFVQRFRTRLVAIRNRLGLGRVGR